MLNEIRIKVKKFLYSNYCIKTTRIISLTGGFRNNCYKIFTNNKSFVFIIYKKEKNILKKIKSAHFSAQCLNSNNFKTRIPIANKEGKFIQKIKIGRNYHFCALYNFLRGETIPWEAYTKRHIKSIGKSLSDIHFTLLPYKNYAMQSNYFLKWEDITNEEIKLMEKYFQSVSKWIIKKLCIKINFNKIDYLFRKIRTICKNYNSYIIHFDFLRGNILFSKKINKRLDIYPIIGILDFEKSCLGPLIADIARTLSFLIIDCKYHEESFVRKRFLQSGYLKRGKNKINIDSSFERDLDELITYYNFVDFWKFLVHNPYESLNLNEHYLRTRDQLLKNRLLEVV